MKQRILTGWTFQRALYLLMGGFIVIQSIVQHEWVGILFGSYFAAMGLFAFGCAAGNCFGGNCTVDTKEKINSGNEAVEFEEVK